MNNGHGIRLILIGLGVVATFVFLKAMRRHPRRRSFLFAFKGGGYTFYSKGDFQVKLMRGQKLPFTVTPVDSGGTPADIDPNPGLQCTSSDETILKIEQINANSFVGHWVGAGTAVVQVTGDADLGDGVKQIVGTGSVECVGGEAVGFDIEFGAPQPEEPAPDAGNGQ